MAIEIAMAPSLRNAGEQDKSCVCSCKGPDADCAFCGVCVIKLLQDALRHQEEARQERERQGEICQKLLEQEENRFKQEVSYVISSVAAQTILNDPDISLTENDFTNPARLKAEVDGLRSIITDLTQKCNATAVERDKLAIINSVRLAKVQDDESRLDFLCDTMERVYLEKESGILHVMQNSVNNTLRWNRRIRIQLALKAFAMHRLDVGSDNHIPPITSDDNQKVDTTEMEDSVDENNIAKGTNQRMAKLVNIRPRGVGKICGLPMPHAGSVLFGAMPPTVLTSALRSIASLTHCLGRVLSVPLPHPIDLRPPPVTPKEDEILNGDIVNLSSMKSTDIWGADSPSKTKCQPRLSASSGNTNTIPGHVHLSDDVSVNTTLAPTSSPTGWSIRKTLADAASTAMSRVVSSAATSSNTPKTNAGLSREHSSAKATERMNGTFSGSTVRFTDDAIQERIRYATSAVIRESATSPNGAENSWSRLTTSYILKVSDAASLQDDDFITGLQLLQNDVVAVCINAGVPVSSLWPAEAMLLNLNALRLFCLEDVKNPP